jgi:hypothetical protein
MYIQKSNNSVKGGGQLSELEPGKQGCGKADAGAPHPDPRPRKVRERENKRRISPNHWWRRSSMDFLVMMLEPRTERGGPVGWNVLIVMPGDETRTSKGGPFLHQGRIGPPVARLEIPGPAVKKK